MPSRISTPAPRPPAMAREASAISASVPPSPLLSARSRIKNVFGGDDQQQRPDDQRQNAEHRRHAGRIAGTDGGQHRLAQARKAGWCRCRRRRRRCCRASAPRSWSWPAGRERRQARSSRRWRRPWCVTWDFGPGLLRCNIARPRDIDPSPTVQQRNYRNPENRGMRKTRAAKRIFLLKISILYRTFCARGVSRGASVGLSKRLRMASVAGLSLMPSGGAISARCPDQWPCELFR